MDSTKNSPRSWATPPYCWVVRRRATSTVATMLSPLATRPPTARGPAWSTPPTKDSLVSASDPALVSSSASGASGRAPGCGRVPVRNGSAIRPPDGVRAMVSTSESSATRSSSVMVAGAASSPPGWSARGGPGVERSAATAVSPSGCAPGLLPRARRERQLIEGSWPDRSGPRSGAGGLPTGRGARRRRTWSRRCPDLPSAPFPSVLRAGGSAVTYAVPGVDLAITADVGRTERTEPGCRGRWSRGLSRSGRAPQDTPPYGKRRPDRRWAAITGSS